MRRTPQSLRLEPLEDRALPSYGLDPTFSGDGRETLDPSHGSDDGMSGGQATRFAEPMASS